MESSGWLFSHHKNKLPCSSDCKIGSTVCDITDGLATCLLIVGVFSIHKATTGVAIQIPMRNCSLFSLYLTQIFTLNVY